MGIVDMAIGGFLRSASSISIESSDSGMLSPEMTETGTTRDMLVLMAVKPASLRRLAVSVIATHLLFHFHARAHGLDAVATLDDIGLEGDGARPAVQLEKQAAGIAEDGAGFIATPERSG